MAKDALTPRDRHGGLVELYGKYRSQVHFVVVDLDVQRSPEQQQLVKQYYKGYIPHVLVLDPRGQPLYNQSGEVESRVIEDISRDPSAREQRSSHRIRVVE